MARRKLVVIGLLGTVVDSGVGKRRWERWRPTVAAVVQEDLLVDRFELLHASESQELAEVVRSDMQQVSPETRVTRHVLDVQDPWDFEQMYGALHDFASSYPFDPEREDYLLHISTGTHVAQICIFLLTEARYFPGKLLQTSPDQANDDKSVGKYTIIDLDLSRYDKLASRVQKERVGGLAFLKAGIDTKNVAFNKLIERIEQVALASKAPMLLNGPTGAGKSQLARRIYELKKARRQIKGAFAEVNCATLRGDTAMSALFGHTKGAFTGASADRGGLLRKAHEGLLFLDEVGELGLDEQAMLLRAIEERVFCPMGADREVSSDFQLLCGTNHDLSQRAAEGKFREDLLARINLWTFRLPGLHERPEDIAPNIDFELRKASESLGIHVTLNKEARTRFLEFATSKAAVWTGNFRDLNAAVTRMATLAPAGRITVQHAEEEIERLRGLWKHTSATSPLESEGFTARVLGKRRAAELDRFDKVQLEEVLRVCRDARTLSEAGRVLFAQSRAQRTSTNDADRIRKYLARFELDLSEVHTKLSTPERAGFLPT